MEFGQSRQHNVYYVPLGTNQAEDVVYNEIESREDEYNDTADGGEAPYLELRHPKQVSNDTGNQNQVEPECPPTRRGKGELKFSKFES